MTKQCPQCKRILELNEINFRFSCGYWRNTCRDCQNQRKRFIYDNKKKYHSSKPNAYKVAKKQGLDAMIAKYDEIFKTLDIAGVSVDEPALDIDKALEHTVLLSRKSA